MFDQKLISFFVFCLVHHGVLCPPLYFFVQKLQKYISLGQYGLHGSNKHRDCELVAEIEPAYSDMQKYIFFGQTRLQPK